MTVTEFAAAVLRSEQTVWVWIRKGLVKPVDDGRRMMLRKADVRRMKAVAKELRKRVGRAGRKPKKAVEAPAEAGAGASPEATNKETANVSVEAK